MLHLTCLASTCPSVPLHSSGLVITISQSNTLDTVSDRMKSLLKEMLKVESGWPTTLRTIELKQYQAKECLKMF